MLISALRSHPQIHAEGELLQRVGGTSVTSLLEDFYGRSRPRSVAAVGFKVFYYHPLDADSDAAWSAIEAIEGLHFVHLKRRNRLRTVTSRRIADETDAWVVPDSGPSGAPRRPSRVTFSTGELVAAFEETEAYELAFEERFSDRPLLDVHYEDLATDLDAAMRPITEFLGVEARRLQPATRHQHPQPLSALIANYEDLAREFEGSRWSEFFDG